MLANANGTTIERNVFKCSITLPQASGRTPANLGGKNIKPLVGAMALGILGWSRTLPA